MEYLKAFGIEFLEIMNEMAPWLMIGFFFAGILYVFFPKTMISKYLGKNNKHSVVNAAILGVPLPLCSCGVIPTGISFFKNGASKGSSVSFLISTPQTGVDSVMVTYSLLGLPFALIRPVIAFVTGIVGGWITNKTTAKETDKENEINGAYQDAPFKERLKNMFHYAFVEFMQDISKWLVIGLVIAALFSVLIPDDFFATYLSNNMLSMLIVLVASIPFYVCATSSVPIAAVLLMKGLSPGAALVFLMAGPATNAATMTVVGKVMGKKTLYTYLASIIAGALIFGFLIDNFLPAEWFSLGSIMHLSHDHEHSLLPEWLKIASSITLFALMINGWLRRYVLRKKPQSETGNINENDMSTVKLTVNGMECNHCKANVENAIKGFTEIKTFNVDLASQTLTLDGDNLPLDKIKKEIEDRGYKVEE